MDTNTNTETIGERLDVVVQRIVERQGEPWRDTHAEHVITKLRCMVDAANVLGGDSLASLDRSLRTIDRFNAKLHRDTAPLSLCWEGAGMFGGLIFHWHAREWSIHT